MHMLILFIPHLFFWYTWNVLILQQFVKRNFGCESKTTSRETQFPNFIGRLLPGEVASRIIAPHSLIGKSCHMDISETNVLTLNCGRVCMCVCVDKLTPHHCAASAVICFISQPRCFIDQARLLNLRASLSTISYKCHGSDVTWF